MILCLFNAPGAESLTYAEIKDKSAIPDAELNNALLYLCNPKLKILNKENLKKPAFAPNEAVTVNMQFQNNNLKV